MARPPRDLEDLPYRERVSIRHGRKDAWDGDRWVPIKALRKAKPRRSPRYVAEMRRRRRLRGML